MENAKIRLYVDHPLGAGQSVPLNRDQANYLFAVMRLSVGQSVLLFNGQDGEWLAQVATANKRNGVLRVMEQTRPLQMPPDVWLLFAPIKKARTDFIVEKATELGAARILPVQTRYTNSTRLRQDRLQAHAVEAAEQCGGTFVPSVEELHPLEQVLAHWANDRRLLFCDERQAGGSTDLAASLVKKGMESGGGWAILIGPEGGFSQEERNRLRAFPQAIPIGLGPRILRADTACVAALTLWQLELGDWV